MKYLIRKPFSLKNHIIIFAKAEKVTLQIQRNLKLAKYRAVR